jgi:hypothetical protein
MLFLDAGPDVTPITNLIITWTHIGQALVGSIGALGFIFALKSRMAPAAMTNASRCEISVRSSVIP